MDLCIPMPPHTFVYLCLPVFLLCTCPPFPIVDTHSLMGFVHSPSLSGLCLFSSQHPLPPQGSLPDLDIYLYNKPGGQGTGGKGIVQGTTRCGKAFSCLMFERTFPSLTVEGDLVVRLGVWKSQT